MGTSFYEYLHPDDMQFLIELHKNILQTTEKITTKLFRFRCKNNNFIQLQSEWKSFKNPWTADIEYLMGKHSIFL